MISGSILTGSLWLQEIARIELQNYLTIVFPMMLAGCLFMSLQASMTQAATEINKGIKEALLVKGMRRDAFWFAWLIGQGGVTMVAAALAVAALYIFKILENTNVFFTIGLFVVFSLAQTAFGLMIVALMGRDVDPKKCFLAGIIILMLSQGVYFLVEYLMIQKAVGDFWIYLTFTVYIIPFCHVFFHLSDAELLQVFVAEQSPHMFWALGMLVFDCLLYIAIILAVDYAEEAANKASGDTSTEEQAGQPSTGGRGICVRKLVKTYGAPAQCGQPSTIVEAVRGIDLDVPEKNIFALLGHNGAGKTTTIKMLIGSEEPTSGDAWVGGLHVVRDREELRASLGLCPQFDVLYDEMTAGEQLTLYGGMAGLNDADAEQECDRLLALLALTAKKNEPVDTLSGGQKRRISLATALIGNPVRPLRNQDNLRPHFLF